MSVKNSKEIKVPMELSQKEANLIRRIRDVQGSGEFLLAIEAHNILRLKYTKVFFQLPNFSKVTNDQLVGFIKDKVPFGEVVILTRAGKPYGITSTIQYDELSDGL